MGPVDKILSRLPEPIPDYDDCANRMTDLPCGTLRPTRDATWGCAGRVLRTEEPETASPAP